MSKFLSILAVIGFSSGVAFAANHVLDTAHSNIGFAVKHMVVSQVKGHFGKFEGTFDYDEATKELKSVQVKIEASSIATNDPKRDDHLRSGDFLQTDKFPTITFKSDKAVKIETGKATAVPGQLMIRDKTKPVTLMVEYHGSIKDPWGNNRMGFSANTSINRKDFGVNFSKALDNGGLVVANEVSIQIEGEAIPAPEEKKKK